MGIPQKEISVAVTPTEVPVFPARRRPSSRSKLLNQYAEKPRQSYFQSYTVIGHADCPFNSRLAPRIWQEIELIDRRMLFDERDLAEMRPACSKRTSPAKHLSGFCGWEGLAQRAGRVQLRISG